MKLHGAPRGRQPVNERLEVIELLNVLLHVSRYWEASKKSPTENKRVEKASVSTQLVLNKYNINYETLRLADSTTLAFKSWQDFIKTIY